MTQSASTASRRRVVAVTGATAGIGRASALAFAERGDDVALLARGDTGLAEACKEVESHGVRCLTVEVDVADPAVVAAAFARVREELGAVGIVVANAGYAPFTRTTDISAELWARALAVNLTGTFTCVQAAPPDMIAARCGGSSPSPRSPGRTAVRGRGTTARPRAA